MGEIVRRQSRTVFGARLSVLTVSSAIWQETVTGIAELSAIPLIDISEPTENVLWEVEELVRRFGDRCVFIGAYDRLQELTTREPDPLMERLSTFLDGRQVLGYKSDARGRKRFVRALGSTLERHIRRPLAGRHQLVGQVQLGFDLAVTTAPGLMYSRSSSRSSTATPMQPVVGVRPGRAMWTKMALPAPGTTGSSL